MKNYLIILFICLGFSVLAQTTHTPTGVTNLVSTSGWAYVTSNPNWIPTASNKYTKNAYNYLTNEFWLFDQPNGVWVLSNYIHPATNGLKIDNDSLKLGGTLTENTVINSPTAFDFDFKNLNNLSVTSQTSFFIGRPTPTSWGDIDTTILNDIKAVATNTTATGFGYIQNEGDGDWYNMVSATYDGAAITVFDGGGGANPELKFMSANSDVNILPQIPTVGEFLFGIRAYKHKGLSTNRNIVANGAGNFLIKSQITNVAPTTNAISANLSFGVLKDQTATNGGHTAALTLSADRDVTIPAYTSSGAKPVTATAQLVVDATGKVGTQAISAISTYAVSGTGSTGSSSIITATGTDVTFTKVGAAEWRLDVPSTTTDLLTADLFISAADNPTGTLVLNIHTLSTVFNQGNSTAKVPIVRGVTLTGGLYDQTTGVTNLVTSVVSVGSGDIQVSITNYTSVLGAGDTILKVVF